MDATATDVAGSDRDSPAGPDGQTAPHGQTGPAQRGRRIRWSPDASVMSAYLALAVLVTGRLWLSGGSATTAENTGDHAQFLFFFEHAASAVINGHHPLFTGLMGAPDGVNLMANTSFLGMAIPLIPVTLLAGPGVSFTLAVTIGLAGTAAAWYAVLRRHVTTSRPAAFVAATLAGFGPGIVGHANGHPNLTAQFMLPLIVSAVIRLRTTARPVRSGLLLGLMITYQLFLNEELLLFTALACAIMTIVYVISRPAQSRTAARPFLTGLGVAAGLSAVLAAYPLWFQFFGPQHYRGPFTWAPGFSTDLVEYAGYGAGTLAGLFGASDERLNPDPAETNAFLGLPLCLIALVAAVLLWRVLAARIASVVGLTFGLLSLGDPIEVAGIETIPGPWRLVAGVPLLDSVIKLRLGLVVTPAVAVLVAIIIDRLLAEANRDVHNLAGANRDVHNLAGEDRGASGLAGEDRGASGLARAEAGSGGEPGSPRFTPHRLRRGAVWGLLAVALLPLLPTPVRTTQPDPVPAFITDGTWRDYVDDGTVVPVALTSTEMPIRWVSASGLQLRVAAGYFLGPSSPEDPIARYGPPERTAGQLFLDVAESGDVPEITDELRAAVLNDLRYWQADVVVLPPHANADALRQTVAVLLDRPGEEHGDTWVWDVRDLVSGQR